MKIVATARRGGKTTQLLDWVFAGKRVEGYPGWSRVLIVCNRQHLDFIRRVVSDRLESEGISWSDFDFSHRVYSWEEWETAVGINPDTEVMIDDIEFLLPRGAGRLIGFSITGQPITGSLDWACKLDTIEQTTNAKRRLSE